MRNRFQVSSLTYDSESLDMLVGKVCLILDEKMRYCNVLLYHYYFDLPLCGFQSRVLVPISATPCLVR